MNFINKKEVCDSLQISGDTFGTWVGLGLPEYRIGRIILIKRDELEAFIEAHGSAAINQQINQILEGMQ
ncbi:MAG: helix-turn-helix domain-containing protein [Chlorobium sp.]|nr:helix-turn-helix domain-containing protein [Chlorobium sp.]